jgi:hypothetical protein
MNQVSFSSNKILLVTIGSALILAFWILFTEHGQMSSDTEAYMKMYQGEKAIVPFGYRILTPFLASLIPSSMLFGFGFVSSVSLVLTTPLIALYSYKLHFSKQEILLSCLFWSCTYAFVYYGVSFFRVDAPMYLCLAAFLVLSLYKKNILILFLVLAIGQLAHETILIALPIIFADKIFKGKFSGGQLYSYKELTLLAVLVLAEYVLVRRLIFLPKGDIVNYMSNSPMTVVKSTIESTGGLIKYLMRIYATHGPLIVYAVTGLTLTNSWRQIASFAVVFFAAIFLSLFATDTLRVMSIVTIPIIVLGVQIIYTSWKLVNKGVGYLLIGLQLLYSWLVFGHLRSFESSKTMNIIAIIISFIAFVTSAYVLANIKKRREVNYK